MPIVHRNKSNYDIKQYLRMQKITYSDLANASGYAKGTIDQWMRQPLSSAQRELIRSSIDKIMKSRPTTGFAPTCHNYQLQKLLNTQNVSYSELGKRLGKSPSYIWNKLNNTNLSNDEKAMFIKAIDDIVEERRSLHED